MFTRTKRRADKIWKQIARAGHKVARIHADRSQAQRRMALDGFKDGTYRVLVATDIAARGIDVADIGHVVNFDLPHVPEDYVHRVGRTARAAASGRASSFSAPEEHDLLHAIERLTRAVLPRGDVPRDADTFQKELERAAAAQADPGPRSRVGSSPRGTRSPPQRAAAAEGRRLAPAEVRRVAPAEGRLAPPTARRRRERGGHGRLEAAARRVVEPEAAPVGPPWRWRGLSAPPHRASFSPCSSTARTSRAGSRASDSSGTGGATPSASSTRASSTSGRTLPSG